MSCDRADLISDAVFGLMNAVDKYEADRGHRLSTYAGHGIVFAVRQWLKRQDRSREYPFDPVDCFEEMPVTEDEPACEIAERQDATRRVVRDAMRALPERYREILETRIMADPPATLKQLGARYGVSKERIRQVEIRALDVVCVRLRKSMKGAKS